MCTLLWTAINVTFWVCDLNDIPYINSNFQTNFSENHSVAKIENINSSFNVNISQKVNYTLDNIVEINNTNLIDNIININSTLNKTIYNSENNSNAYLPLNKINYKNNTKSNSTLNNTLHSYEKNTKGNSALNNTLPSYEKNTKGNSTLSKILAYKKNSTNTNNSNYMPIYNISYNITKKMNNTNLNKNDYNSSGSIKNISNNLNNAISIISPSPNNNKKIYLAPSPSIINIYFNKNNLTRNKSKSLNSTNFRNKLSPSSSNLRLNNIDSINTSPINYANNISNSSNITYPYDEFNNKLVLKIDNLIFLHFLWILLPLGCLYVHNYRRSHKKNNKVGCFNFTTNKKLKRCKSMPNFYAAVPSAPPLRMAVSDSEIDVIVL